MFAEGCGCGAGTAWLSRGRPTTRPGGARGLGQKGSGGGRVLGDRPWRWAVGEAPDSEPRALFVGESSQPCQGGRSKASLEAAGSVLIIAPEIVLAFLGVHSCFVGASYTPPLQTFLFFLFFFPCFTFFFPIMVGLEFWIFSLSGIFMAGDVMQGSWGDIPILQIGN